MFTKRFPRSAGRSLGIAVLALLLPAIVPGEVVRLKDGSTLKGRLMRVEGDTLTIRLSVGAPIKIHRSVVESIVFSDSIPPSPPAQAVVSGAGVPPADPVGVGTVSIKFEDRNVSSKITIDKKKHWDEKVASNAIVVEFVVDGVVKYTAIDTTTDKTIYLGHDKQLKNDTELADFDVQVPAGTRRCSLVLRNQDPDTFRDSFDPAPLNAVLDLGETYVRPGGLVRVDVRIDKGLLRTSSPKLYRGNHVEKDD
ncbi:MAG TPA: hypothetical protein VEC56_06570 [Candidatus Krumholzibacteria bacterium]|nr:hypothetical protein [Candidatus Krumholzibacteria bacterium]